MCIHMHTHTHTHTHIHTHTHTCTHTHIYTYTHTINKYTHKYLLLYRTGFFNIDDDGRITTTAMLDRESTSSYTLMVETVDMGSPQQTCSATVNIMVLDANDNAPSFVNCEGPHNVTEVSFCSMYTYAHMYIHAYVHPCIHTCTVVHARTHIHIH